MAFWEKHNFSTIWEIQLYSFKRPDKYIVILSRISLERISVLSLISKSIESLKCCGPTMKDKDGEMVLPGLQKGPLDPQRWMSCGEWNIPRWIRVLFVYQGEVLLLRHDRRGQYGKWSRQLYLQLLHQWGFKLDGWFVESVWGWIWWQTEPFLKLYHL